jgi:hypothetical protein
MKKIIIGILLLTLLPLTLAFDSKCYLFSGGDICLNDTNIYSVTNNWTFDFEAASFNADDLVGMNISIFNNDVGYLTEANTSDFLTLINLTTYLSNYYNKTEIDTLLDNLDINLTDYYNKSEIDTLLDNLDINLTDYYNKTEIDNLNVSHFNNDAGYLTSYTETDPVFVGSDVYDITDTDQSNWDTAYGWGDHSTEGYLTSYTETDPIWNSEKGNYYTSTQIDNFNFYSSTDFLITDYVLKTTLMSYSYYNASNFNITDYYTKTQINNNLSNYYLASNPNGYISDYTVTSEDVTQHQADINITESQITDLQDYLLTETDPVWTADKSDYYTSIEVDNLPISTFSNDVGYLTSFTELDPYYFANPNGYYNSSDFNITDYYTQTQSDNRYVYRDGDELSAVFNYTNSTIRLDADTNLFFYDTSDEAKHLNSFAENYDRLRVNTFTVSLTLNTFTNATGSYINISSESGQDIGVILNNGQYADSYRFDYNNTVLELIEGTDDEPILNYVYAYNNAGTPVMQVSATKPMINHAMLATVNVGANGYVYWASLQEDSEDEFLKKVQRTNRKRGLLYESGLDYNATATSLGIGAGDYINGIYDLYTTYINSSVNGIYTILNNGSYAKYTDFADLMNNGQYSDGTTFGSNKYVNVVFGVTPYDGSSRLYAVVQNTPTNEYTSISDAYSDTDNKLNVYPSDEETRLMFLPVARMIFNTNSGEAQIIVNSNYAIDYRGGVAGGVSSGGGLVEADPVFTASDVADITDTDQANWDEAYGWGDHALEGYLTTESDPFYFSNPNGYYNSSNFNITDYYTQTQVDNLPISTFSNDVGYITDYTVTSEDVTQHQADINITESQITDLQSYLLTETDPIFVTSHANDISTTNTTQWNTAYGWGDHSTEGYLTNYTETDPIWTADKSDYYNTTQVDNLIDTVEVDLSDYYNTTQTDNTFIKQFTSSDDTTIGYTAGDFASGTNNTNYGFSSGSVSSGSHTTSIGYLTGVGHSGSQSTFVGDYAGYLNTVAGSTAVGYEALKSNTGSFSIGIGKGAGISNQGTNTIAIGTLSASSNTGTHSTFLGYNSGLGNSGDYIFAIGGATANFNSGDNGVFIGNGAGSSNTDDNMFILKHDQANANALITGNFSSGDVDILGEVSATNINDANWDTAYGWGDHSTQGYITNDIATNVDMNDNDITAVDCITFTSGGQICSS